ncbi:MAG: hypothetical protein HGA22_00165 [Clostridiales bacterium]|nr:hypothetical protein [Clostridiales bacterium]
MGTFYTIMFEPEESQKWMSYNDNEELAVRESIQYELYCETTEEGEKKYFIINERGERVYDIWHKTRGDLVSLLPI